MCRADNNQRIRFCQIPRPVVLHVMGSTLFCTGEQERPVRNIWNYFSKNKKPLSYTVWWHEQPFTTYYMRSTSTLSKIFADEIHAKWNLSIHYNGLHGITQIGIRPPLTPDLMEKSSLRPRDPGNWLDFPIVPKNHYQSFHRRAAFDFIQNFHRRDELWWLGTVRRTQRWLGQQQQ